MRRARPYRGENSEPGKDDRGELDTETRNWRTPSTPTGLKKCGAASSGFEKDPDTPADRSLLIRYPAIQLAGRALKMRRHQLGRREFIADWRRGARAAVCKVGADWITVIQPERINTHGGRKKYEAPSRCADDIVSRGSWCECHKLNCKAEDDASRFTYVRLHCAPDNQSHFTDVTIELAKENFAPLFGPFRCSRCCNIMSEIEG
jgi:hypothetical protein